MFKTESRHAGFLMFCGGKGTRKGKRAPQDCEMRKGNTDCISGKGWHSWRPVRSECRTGSSRSGKARQPASFLASLVAAWQVDPPVLSNGPATELLAKNEEDVSGRSSTGRGPQL